MLALFKQLAARTLSSISFTLMLSSFFSFMFSSLTPAGVSEENMKLKKLLNMSVNEIELSVRAANCLNNANRSEERRVGTESRARWRSDYKQVHRPKQQ